MIRVRAPTNGAATIRRASSLRSYSYINLTHSRIFHRPHFPHTRASRPERRRALRPDLLLRPPSRARRREAGHERFHPLRLRVRRARRARRRVALGEGAAGERGRVRHSLDGRFRRGIARELTQRLAAIAPRGDVLAVGQVPQQTSRRGERHESSENRRARVRAHGEPTQSRRRRRDSLRLTHRERVGRTGRVRRGFGVLFCGLV